jgi:hypothetical protein
VTAALWLFDLLEGKAEILRSLDKPDAKHGALRIHGVARDRTGRLRQEALRLMEPEAFGIDTGLMCQPASWPMVSIRPCNSILSQERLLMLKCGYE